jgi:hypothetical protein
MKKIFIASFFMIGFAVAGFSQTVNTYSAALMAKAQTFTNEVFLNCPVFTDSINVAANAEIINRINVITEPYQSTENYKLLSTVPFKNKCNPAMVRDELNFNPSDFNPLKYFLNWYPDTVTKYRVDNTDYVIVVHPKL